MIKNPKIFAEIVGRNILEIERIIEEIKKDEALMNSKAIEKGKKLSGKYYYRYSKLKSSGKLRVYSPSCYDLKHIQQIITRKIFSQVKFPFYITGSIKKRSGAINAKIHKGKKHHLQTDLVGFFDFVTSKMVYQSLLALGFSPDVSYYITRLTTFVGHLPQGAPTSPFLANLVGLSIDELFISLCHDNQITYSRYVDDLTFSSNKDFKQVVTPILDKIGELGFLFSYKKTHYKTGAIITTGVKSSYHSLNGKDEQIDKCFSHDTSFNSFKGILGHLSYINEIDTKFDLKTFRKKFSELSYPKSIIFYKPKSNPPVLQTLE